MALAALFLVTFSGPAAAAPIDVLNNLVDEFMAYRRPIALVAIVALGFAAKFNVFDPRRAFQVLVGIIFTFGAAEILDLAIAT